MMNSFKIVLVGSLALGVTACSPETGLRWNSEAGAYIDEGGFGNPTMINMMAQMCAQGGKGKGGGVVDPVVVRDGSSTASRPVYYRDHTQCAGNLNGKYAEVIFREYVTSAEPQPSGNELIDLGGGE